MAKDLFKAQISIAILKEGNRYIAFSPAFDLSTSGKSVEDASKHFEEAVQLFFEETMEAGTLEQVLQDLGWKKGKLKWNPPVIVSQKAQTVMVPA